jgi:hypothetical protein
MLIAAWLADITQFAGERLCYEFHRRNFISGILPESSSIPTFCILRNVQIVQNEFVGMSCHEIREPVTTKEWPMRKWFVPLTVLSVGGIGAFLLTDRGRETLRRWRARFDEAPERWVEWNENAQLELERIQAALNQIAESLGPRGEMGR